MQPRKHSHSLLTSYDKDIEEMREKFGELQRAKTPDSSKSGATVGRSASLRTKSVVDNSDGLELYPVSTFLNIDSVKR